MLTPGADQAARPASSFSVHERTLPVSVTCDPAVVHRDPAGVHLRVAPQRRLDLVLHVGGGDLRGQRDVVGHAADAAQGLDRVARREPLVHPLHRPFQEDVAVADA